MKALLLTGLLFILILSGCRKESATLPLLQSVEELIPMYADSASTLLDSIKAPDELGNKDFAHWCMLRGKATDETATGLLPIYQWQRAQKWFMKHGTAEEQAQIALYLGRAYVEDGEYDKAMKIYAEALQLAKEHQAYNVAGYICAYMADLYGFRDIISERLEKREEACEFFKKAENYKSYAYALKDLACECTLTDSFNCTIPLLQKADSISQLIPNKDLIAAVANAFGLVYKMQGKYKDAEKHHLKAIETGSEESYKDSVALLHIYIKDNQLAKAHEIIESTTKKKDICYNINEAYYLLCKAEGKYKEALHYKEICSDILDSLTLAQNETKVLEIEKKYNNAKIREENELLKIAQQRDMIIIIITISLLLLCAAGYIIYWQRNKTTLYRKQAEIDKMRIEHLHLSMELEEKKQVLQTAMAEQNHKAEELQAEIDIISTRYQQLQQQRLESSIIGKRIATLAKKNKLEDHQTISNDKAWHPITSEIDKIYPRFYSLLKDTFHPTLTVQEFLYCYLHVFGFDGNDEAKLLGVNPDTVRMKRSRINQKRPEASRKETSLRDFLIKNLLK
ncbi:tetratricopeptide repeat protein [Phocaeicola sartorii]|uniref:Tetratricopeptide repeat protein n=1 Tax=Phocaeicola sartorii TaxID=671267 RepID=A0A4S2FIN2_9BACT|nr:tetratricopeptide repeat protein [Phocaeicola sartorii]TGY68720.1 tetratricopeptide repeat protein [Phocaeicola sartorii]